MAKEMAKEIKEIKVEEMDVGRSIVVVFIFGRSHECTTGESFRKFQKVFIFDEEDDEANEGEAESFRKFLYLMKRMLKPMRQRVSESFSI